MSISYQIIDDFMYSGNWTDGISTCKKYVKTPLKPENSIQLAKILSKHAIRLAKENKLKQSITLRKLINSLNLDIPEELYSEISYEYFCYASCALRELGFLKKAKILTEKAIKLCGKYD